MDVEKIPTCRFCGTAQMVALADFAQLARDVAAVPAIAAPRVRVCLCPACWLVETVAEPAFLDSGAAGGPPGDHRCSSRYAAHQGAALKLGPASLVLGLAPETEPDTAAFALNGVPGGLAERSSRLGLPLIGGPVDATLPRRLKAEGRKPDLVLAGDFLRRPTALSDGVGMLAALLSGNAVLALDFPYLLQVMRDLDLAPLCHAPHPCFSLLAVERLLRAAGLRLFDAEPMAGGWLRVHACRGAAHHAEQPGLQRVRSDEALAKLDRPEGCADFAPRLGAALLRLSDFLTSAHHGRKTVVGYGAGAPAALLLAAAGIGPALLTGAVDPQGGPRRLLPGSGIPTLAPDALRLMQPDFMLILPGQSRDRVIADFADLRRVGTRFVTALPQVTVTA